MKTNSRPGRSGASRTSITSNPVSTRAVSTSSRERKRSVDVETVVEPSANRYVPSNVTNGRSTLVTSCHVSMIDPSGPTPDWNEDSRSQLSHARWSGSRVSNTRWPPGCSTDAAASSTARHTQRCEPQNKLAGAATNIQHSPRTQFLNNGDVGIEVVAFALEQVVESSEPFVAEDRVGFLRHPRIITDREIDHHSFLAEQSLRHGETQEAKWRTAADQTRRRGE